MIFTASGCGYRVEADGGDRCNREKWSLYRDAVEEMLLKTSTRSYPWNLEEGNDKYWARVRTLTQLVQLPRTGVRDSRPRLPTRFYGDLRDGDR
jgi:hypothetical protein